MLSGFLVSMHTQLSQYTSICLVDAHTRAYTHGCVLGQGWCLCSKALRCSLSGTLLCASPSPQVGRAMLFYFQSAAESSSASLIGFLIFFSS